MHDLLFDMYKVTSQKNDAQSTKMIGKHDKTI